MTAVAELARHGVQGDLATPPSSSRTGHETAGQRLLDVREAAKILGLTPGTVRVYAGQGKIPVAARGKLNAFLFKRADLIAYIRQSAGRGSPKAPDTDGIRPVVIKAFEEGTLGQASPFYGGRLDPHVDEDYFSLSIGKAT